MKKEKLELIKGPGGWYYKTSSKEESDLYNHMFEAFDPFHVADNDHFLFQLGSENDDEIYDYEYPKHRMDFKKGGSVNIEIEHPGALHREMHIPQDKKIPLKDLKAEKAQAKRTGDEKLMRQTTFAINARKWGK